MPSFNIPEGERVLVELAVGSAVMDKMRGHQTTLADAYAKAGGKDPDSKKHLAGHEAAFTGANYQKLASKVSAPHTFNSQYVGWDIPNGEQKIIERSVGAAILNKIEGKGPMAVLETYKACGGNNARTVHELNKIAGK
jgi:hypothetical protein